jgi:hypothetical protein
METNKVLSIILGSGYIGILGYLSMLALIVFAIVSISRMALQPINERNPAPFLGFAHIQFLFFLLTNGIHNLLILLSTPRSCWGGPILPALLLDLSFILQAFYYEFAFLLFSVFTVCSMSRKWPKPSALTITATFIAVLDFALLFVIFILVALSADKRI